MQPLICGNPLTECVVVVVVPLPGDPRGTAERHCHHAEELSSGSGDRNRPAGGTSHHILNQGEVPRAQVPATRHKMEILSTA